MNVVYIQWIIALFLATTFGEEFKRVCYFTNWSNKRPVVKLNFQLVDIDPSLCTHIVYAFAKLDTASKRLVASQSDDDNGQLGALKHGRFFDFTALKKHQPGLVTLLSVGGAGDKVSGEFASVSQSEEDRRLFARNCRIFLRDRDFDGLDIDWEFPTDIFKDDFTLMLKALREEFEQDSLTSKKKRLILTIAAGASEKVITDSYNVTEIVKYVDFINVMTYDYFGEWSKLTGFTSPLYSRHSNRKFNPTLSQDWTIRKWISVGAPSDKLVLGTTGKALSFVLGDPNSNGVGAPVEGPTKLGGVFPKSGSLAYFEVCQWLKQGATIRWDDEQKMHYAYKNNVWVGYESTRSIKEKVKYAKGMGLGGMMFWSFDLDDFYVNLCSSVRFPLLKALREAATNGSYTRFTTTTSTTTTTKSTAKAPVTGTMIPDSVTSEYNNTGKTEQNTTKNSTSNSGEQNISTVSGQTDGNAIIIQTDKPLKLPPSDDNIKVFILDKGCSLNTNVILIVVLSVVAIFNMI